MPEYEGRLQARGRLAIVVARYNEVITGKLLDGARQACTEAGYAPDDVDVCWVSGAFEIPAVVASLAQSSRYELFVALGAVIRGETPHFEFVAGETARGLNATAVEWGIPVAFGVLTVDTFEQAAARAGGSAGNKGYEAAAAAICAADLLAQIEEQA
jgi:6,7-dimethyl-8-ribityllumazine synthase